MVIYISQIWLNLPIDDHHFGYITKLTKKTLRGKLVGGEWGVE
jgi:hypothetical protein